MKKYDYLIVGAGLFGAVAARELSRAGKKCLIIDKRDHIGGNIYTERQNGIDVHKYGAHIFHTNNRKVWDYISNFSEFNHYINSPLANFKGEIYNLPFNMNTFYAMWGVTTPDEARKKIEDQKRGQYCRNPSNLKEQAVNLVGPDIYEKLIRGYTEKQWGRSCEDLPPFIIKRLPVRFTYDNNYFNARFQGIPVDGYTNIISRMTEGLDIRLNSHYLDDREFWSGQAGTIVFTGPIDSFFDYELGTLEYRKVRFETRILDIPDFQGNAVVNYTDRETPFTRIIEHKHFNFGEQPHTVISYEFSDEWKKGDEPYYPVNDLKNSELYGKYRELASGLDHVIFGGRLGEYRYYDMDVTIERALETVRMLLNREG
ncbi:UDP-galactopyranose mutase [Spirochaeta isovalerica]|uniref:UDP-galactopyranose mutase n=1 Tax=Spirochaeta isovalerica TaxID=150 RepID=A0A841R426_9SPIO|nr:UDP-galactopyranose mutase [Spirochaeta isovalerica]MBB6479844.1 UDP-galactopyranose mutase [Spirochaeta isovalerica]